MTDDPVLAEALLDLERGWALLPVDVDKRPRLDLIEATRGERRWRSLRDRPADTDELRTWRRLDATAGIGVITGSPSGGLVVVDVDDPAAAPVMPQTAVSRTARGFHHFYAGGAERVASTTLAWGEIKAEGTFVVAPPSSRRHGQPYRWIRTPEANGGLCKFSAASCLTRATCFKGSKACSPSALETSRPSPPTSTNPCDLSKSSEGQDARARVLPSWLVELDRDEGTALRLAVALGVPEDVRLGESFHCILHDERTPSAALWRRADGQHVRYHDWHAGVAGDEDAWLSLAYVRARQAGRLGRLSPSELTVWKLRLAREAGLLDVEVADVDDPVWAGFLDLCALRRLVDGGAETPYSSRFAAAWCSVSQRVAHEATRELSRRRLLVSAGTDQRGTPLWLPHPQARGA